MEADLQRYYQLDARQALEGPNALGARRALVLIKGLPADSATALSYTEGMAWTGDTELAALQAELMHTLIRITASAAGAKKQQLPKELRIPRPYDPPKQKRPKATMQDLAIAFGRQMDIEPGD